MRVAKKGLGQWHENQIDCCAISKAKQQWKERRLINGVEEGVFLMDGLSGFAAEPHWPIGARH